jgi:hypothetical protein
MNYQGIESKINPEDETSAIVEFLNKNWDIYLKPKKSLSNIIDYVLQEGIHYGVALQEKKIQEIIPLYTIATRLKEDNEKKTETISFERTTKDEDKSKDFPKRIEYIKSRLKKEGLVSAQPKGYDAFKKAHDTEDFAYRNKKVEFKGVKLHNAMSHVVLNFVDTLAKGNIHYSEKEQGRPPITGLVSAIYRQGMSIGMYLVEQRWGTTKDMYEKIENLSELMTKMFNNNNK